MFPNIDGGAGGVSPDFSSSAKSGDVRGSVDVRVGDFNPPMMQSGHNQTILIVAIAAAVGLWIWKSK